MDVISLYNSILSDVQPQEKLQQNIELLTIDKAIEQDKDVLLLKLSTLRQLYTLTVSSELDLKDWRKELCHLLLSHSLQGVDITSDLVTLLYNSESFVCYATYKSLLSILVSPLCCSEIFEYTIKKLIMQLVGDQFHLLQHAQLYGFQLITELLKHLRKMTLLNTLTLTDKVERKKSFCVSLLLSFWPELLKIISIPSKLSIKSDINHILLQFLLLSLELLRHSNKNSIILTVLVPTLGHIADIIHECSSSCLLSLTRMCDLFRKCIKYPLPQTTLCCLTRKEFLHAIITSLTKWFQRESGSCYLCMISLEMNCSFPSIEDMTSPKTLEDGINDTFVRKSFLLSLLLAESPIKQWIPLSAFIHSLEDLTSQFPSTLPCKFIMQQLIIHLVSEQDSCLVDVLKSCLQLSKAKCELSRSQNDEVLSALNINGLMVEFLFSISFDYSTLLDFIINVETEFDCFLEEYLSFLSEETIMTELFYLCKERDVIERTRIDKNGTTLEEEDIKDCQLSSIQLEVSHKQEKDSHSSPVVQSTRNVSETLVCLVAYSSSESEDEGQDNNVTSIIDHSAVNIYNRIMNLFEQLHYSLSKITADNQLMIVESKLIRIVKITKFINKIGSKSDLYQ